MFGVLPRSGTSLFLVPRLRDPPAHVALNGGPSLVSGCCGSPWAADRPTYGRFLAPAGVSGRAVAIRGESSRPAFHPFGWKGLASALSVSVTRPKPDYSPSVVCLSMMICSTALAVYPPWGWAER